MEFKVFTKIFSEMREQPVSFAGSIASLTALINTSFAVPSFISGSPSIPTINSNLIIILCLFFILEGALASVFSRVYVYMRGLGEGFPIILTFINALVSAWVTGYNCIWIFGSFAPKFNELHVFFGALTIGWIISVYFLHHHFVQKKNLELGNSAKTAEFINKQYKKDFWVSFCINFFAFVFVLFYLGSYVSDL